MTSSYSKAGLSITEVMAQLRDDHGQELAKLMEERENLVAERDFAVKNFEERKNHNQLIRYTSSY